MKKTKLRFAASLKKDLNVNGTMNFKKKVTVKV